MIKTVNIFGHDIPIRTHYCSLFKKDSSEVDEPGVTLIIRTKFCNAKCEFCIFADTASKFNEEKYIDFLKEVRSKINIKKIAFTGGEPTLYWEQFKSMVNIANELKSEDTVLTMNTDGFRLKQLFEDPVSKLFTNIHISRHHYNDDINNTIFKTYTPNTEELKIAQSLTDNKHQIQISCNLIKGYIDSVSEVFKMLEWVNGLEINNVGLVSLMPVNDYSKENFIKFNVKDLICENFNVTKEWSYKNSCQCTNYVYFPENTRNPMKVYHKNTYAPFDMNEILIFDGENVRVGYDGEKIA